MDRPSEMASHIIYRNSTVPLILGGRYSQEHLHFFAFLFSLIILVSAYMSS